MNAEVQAVAAPWRPATEKERSRGPTSVRDSSHAGALAATVQPLAAEWCWRVFRAAPASSGHHFTRMLREGRAAGEAEARAAADESLRDLGWEA